MPDQIDFSGMNPEQISDVGSFANAMAGRQLQAARMVQQGQQFEQRMQSERVNQKLKLLDAMINKEFQKKKLKIQQQRADAYERYYNTQSNKAKMEMEQLERQAEFLDNAQNIQVDTTAGKTSLAMALRIGDKLPGFQITDNKWKKINTWVNDEGMQMATLLQPATGKTKTSELGKVGVEGQDLEKWETPGAKIKEAEMSLNKHHGVGAFTELDPQEADQWADEKQLAIGMMEESGWQLPAGKATQKSYNLVQKYNKQFKELQNLRGGRSKQIDQVKKVIRTMSKMAPYSSEYNDVANLVQPLVDKGYSQEEAADLINAAWTSLRGKNEE